MPDSPVTLDEMIAAVRYAEREIASIAEAGGDVDGILSGLRAVQVQLEASRWRPIDEQAKQEADEKYVWTCIAGTTFSYLATYEDADWWTLNQQYESAYKHDDPKRLYKPTHWMPFEAMPAPSATASEGSEGA